MIVDRAHFERQGFSLIELLMSIMILAIGLISVAALFPAGIVQQQRAKESIDGPSVARSALETLRSKLSQTDFGDWTDFYTSDEIGELFREEAFLESPSYYLEEGDWPWLRPALINPQGWDGDDVYRGAVDVFNWNGARDSATTVTDLDTDQAYFQYCYSRNLDSNSAESFNEPLGIPFARSNGSITPPEVIFTMADRTWPPNASGDVVPEYFWDFSLCRRGGVVYAAVFIYKIGGGVENAKSWLLEPARIGTGRAQIPMPASTKLSVPWNAGDGDGFIRPLPGTDGEFDPLDASTSWQYPGQWMVDNLGSIHHVERGRTRPDQTFDDGKGVLLFERVAADYVGGEINAGVSEPGEPVPRSFAVPLPESAFDAFEGNPASHAGGYPDASVPVIDRLWFVPRTIETINGGSQKQWELIPIYVMIERL